jgi:HD-GYP domain-containing protein (c-di-GMP phosphodiesterase class II)
LSITLLVENNPKIESFYTLNLSTWLGLETLTARKSEGALKVIEAMSSEIQLIVVRAVIQKEETARLIIDFLASRDLTIPVIVVGPTTEFPGSIGHITNALQLKVLIQTVAKALKITAKEMSEKPVPDFFPISIEYFKQLKRSTCTVYEDVDGQFPMKFEKLKDFEPGSLDKLITAGVKKLYVNKLDRLEFVNNVSSEIMSTLEHAELTVDENISAADKSIELLSRKLLNLGINEETIQLANKNIAAMRKNARSYPKLGKLLDRLINNKASYLYKHSQILTYICLHIVKNIDWGNAEQEDKISFIAFFHDIVLENDTQAKIKSTLELKKTEFTPAERTLVDKHAQMAAEFVQKFPHAPMGSDQIIRQHHGTLNGIGFSEHYGNNVSPVAVVFIIAEEFTRLIMENEAAPLNKEELMKNLREEFSTSRFQKILDLLETISL